MNVSALDVVKPFLTSAYIYSLKRVIQDLRQTNPTFNLKPHICLDESSRISFTYQTFDNQQEYVSIWLSKLNYEHDK
ncbi:Protein of unknown function [Lactobacillus hominis DSM 23910 = CRBIP 24.179]|uniref:Uncharacterized protein n=1 Tax=Lactobacillus hominis DSM 23910 = CRBIP 24.179 TaxID=1423758 RepID=I7L8W5_9LACO|nr:Protein of unknown function [Lactobacillus hominis DSM 23910 = CRBIP 24.179]